MGWIIALTVILALFLLLCCSAAVRLEYLGEIRVKISYLCFTIVKFPAVKKKNKRKDKKAKKALKAADSAAMGLSGDKSGTSEISAPEKTIPSNQKEKKAAPDKKGKKASLKDYFEIAKLAVDSLGKPLKKLLRRTRIYDLRINIVCGGEDAAKAALNFGKTNIMIGSALGWIDNYFTLKPAEEIRINADFQSEETTAEASCLIKMSLFTALAFLFTLFFRAVKYYKSHREAERAVGMLRK